jgi:hypothetical protein
MMPDEVSGHITGGNGERVELRLGSKSLGISAVSLIPILVLICGGIAGYLVYQNQMEALRLLYTRQEQLVKEMQALELRLKHDIAVHDYNSGREPSERLPLELTPPSSAPSHPPQEVR